jgi:hypothetical protein
MGENLIVVWAEFSTVIQAVFVWHGLHKHAHTYSGKLIGPGLVQLVNVCPWTNDLPYFAGSSMTRPKRVS